MVARDKEIIGMVGEMGGLRAAIIGASARSRFVAVPLLLPQLLNNFVPIDHSLYVVIPVQEDLVRRVFRTTTEDNGLNLKNFLSPTF